jgi:hypothetical protein
MPDRPAPDESSGVPLCSASCPLYSEGDGEETFGTCGADGGATCFASYCLPRIRELVALSRRRCDGCRRWHRTPGRAIDGVCSVRVGWVPAHGCCEEWEAKP